MNLTFIPGTKICTVEDVLTLEQTQAIVDSVNRAHGTTNFDFSLDDRGEQFWKDKNISVFDLDCGPEPFWEIEKVEAKAFEQYLEFLGDERRDYRLTSFSTIHRWGTGADMQAHSDSQDGNEQIKYGMVFYINGDYEGGEIYYPEWNLEIKPKPGLLVMHPGDIIHGVRPVTSGVRVNMTAFGLDS